MECKQKSTERRDFERPSASEVDVRRQELLLPIPIRAGRQGLWNDPVGQTVRSCWPADRVN